MPPRSTAALIRWYALVTPTTVLLKDGCLMGAFMLSGMDLDTASPLQKEATARVVNQALAHLDDGWMIHVEVLRIPTFEYPKGEWSECITQLIDDERRYWHHQPGNGYESKTILFLTWQPSLLEQQQRKITRKKASDELPLTEAALQKFEEFLQTFSDQLSLAFTVRPLREQELIATMANCMNGNASAQATKCPSPPCDLDSLLARDLIVGDPLIYDDRYIGIVSIVGTPDETWANMLSALQHLPFEYRWSIRYIPMGYTKAASHIKGKYLKWLQARQSMTDHLLNRGDATQNLHALAQAGDAQQAQADLDSGSVGFGSLTSVVILRAETQEQLRVAIAEVTGVLTRHSFGIRVECRNAAEAFIGSLPGHGAEDVRKPIFHSLNMAHIMPLGSPWTGPLHDECPFYPPESPCLFQAGSVGRNPFRYPLHVGDTGHTLVLGPTGSGKSTLLSTMVAQFDRYPESQIFIFDKGRSLYPLVKAMKHSSFYTLGSDESEPLCPLGDIHGVQDLAWASEYVETLATLSGLQVTPTHRARIQTAINLLNSTSTTSQERSLYNLRVDIQDEEVKEALTPYVEGGAYGSYLCGSESNIQYNTVTAFELEHLLHLGPKVVTPTLLYLFHEIEKRLDGRPTMIVLDEAWMLLDTPLFAARIKEWLKVLRKKNAACILATQELADIAKSTIAAAVIDSCQARVFLPNPALSGEEHQNLYRSHLQLTTQEMELLASARPKRDYFYTSPLGRRLFSLNLQPASLAFLGSAGPADLKAIEKLIAEQGEEWPGFWLGEKELPEARRYWETLRKEKGE